jgi:hypothetical protein
MNDLHEYPRPAIAVDLVLLSIQAGKLVVLLHKRVKKPFAGTRVLQGELCALMKGWMRRRSAY